MRERSWAAPISRSFYLANRSFSGFIFVWHWSHCLKIYNCSVHSCFGRHYVLWKFCIQLSLTFFCGIYFRSVVYEDFQFKAMFHIVSQDNTVQSQPLFQERLCIISVCVRVWEREGGERERRITVFMYHHCSAWNDVIFQFTPLHCVLCYSTYTTCLGLSC